MNSLKCFETEDNQLCTILVCVKKTWIYGKGISVWSWKAFVQNSKSSHNCSVISPFFIILQMPWPTGFTLHVKHLEKFLNCIWRTPCILEKRRDEAKGPLFWECLSPNVVHNVKINGFLLILFIYLFIFPTIRGECLYRVHIMYHGKKSRKQCRAFQKMKCTQEWVFCFPNVLWGSYMLWVLLQLN